MGARSAGMWAGSAEMWTRSAAMVTRSVVHWTEGGAVPSRRLRPDVEGVARHSRSILMSAETHIGNDEVALVSTEGDGCATRRGCRRIERYRPIPERHPVNHAGDRGVSGSDADGLNVRISL